MGSRSNQKARTRRGLVDAATRLLADGVTDPSMDVIAEAAQVSRATAYRYFDTATDVLWQAVADRDLDDVAQLMAMAGDDVVDRVLAAEQAINGYLFGDPDGARAFERAALGRRLRGVAVQSDRPGRRLGYIDAALEPIADRLPADDLRRVRHALALAMGSQTVPAMLDTCGLDVDEARATTRFACRTIAAEARDRAAVAVR